MTAIQIFLRVLWTLLLVFGVIVFTGVAIGLGFALFSIKENVLLLSVALLPATLIGGIFLMAAGACAAGLFMKARDLRDIFWPPEKEATPAAWVREFRARLGK